MEIDNEQVGFRIKSIRQNKGMTQEEFGNLFDATRSNVSKWERGASLPNKLRLKAIADIGEIDVDELLYGNPNIMITVDDYLLRKLNEYVNIKNQVREMDIELLSKGLLEGTLSVFGLDKGLSDDAVKNYERHNERIKDLEKFGKNYIDNNFINYNYEKYLDDFPDSSPDGFQKYKEKQWNIMKEVFDNFWEAFDITNKNYNWINKRFTEQIADELDEISKVAVNGDKEHYYVNEVVQPFFDQAAKDFKEYIKDYIDAED